MGPRCERCGGAMPVMARRHARYCSGRCRTAACRARNPIPAELRKRPRWVTYSARKVPAQTNGRPASSTDPATWTAYRNISGMPRKGFVLNGDGICCLDLDHCLDGEVLAEWARPVVDACAGTYVEVSPSGTGLHVFGYGHVPVGRRIRGGRQVEVYGTGRYIAVTGQAWKGARSSLADISGVISTLI